MSMGDMESLTVVSEVGGVGGAVFAFKVGEMGMKGVVSVGVGVAVPRLVVLACSVLLGLPALLLGVVVISTGSTASDLKLEVRGEDVPSVLFTKGEKLFLDMMDFSQRSYMFFLSSMHCSWCFSFMSLFCCAFCCASSSGVWVWGLDVSALLVLDCEVDCRATRLGLRLDDIRENINGGVPAGGSVVS